jgi:hypothetical protein
MELRLLAKHNPDNRVHIAAARAMRPLIALLSHPDSLLQEHRVTTLLNLSLCGVMAYPWRPHLTGMAARIGQLEWMESLGEWSRETRAGGGWVDKKNCIIQESLWANS